MGTGTGTSTGTGTGTGTGTAAGEHPVTGTGAGKLTQVEVMAQVRFQGHILSHDLEQNTRNQDNQIARKTIQGGGVQIVRIFTAFCHGNTHFVLVLKI